MTSNRPMLSPEQQGPVRSKAHTLRANAGAGTGKTTMLVAYAMARPEVQILYLAFAKSVELEAKRRFPANVVCKTTHGAAYARFGRPYAEKMVAELRIRDVQAALGLASHEYQLADSAMRLLIRYLASAAERIADIVPPSAHVKAEVIDAADRLWTIMQDPQDKRVGMLHDGYLKRYQLSRPNLSNFPIILLDEAQDTNPVTADIVFRQQSGLFLVGDRHQQIYTFRHAINALDRVPRPQIDEHYLTQSWRFGASIAHCANALLSLKGETRQLKGMLPYDSVAPVDRRGKYTVIARTNAGIFNEAALGSAGRKIAFVGGIDGYRFGQIEDTYHLSRRDLASVRSPYLRAFGDFDSLQAYAAESEDAEAKMLVRVVERHGDRIPQLMASVRSRTVKKEQEEMADIIFTTAHKSKGLEWTNVVLAKDFPEEAELLEMRTEAPEAFVDEINLAYVAVTRAKTKLELCPQLAGLIERTSRARSAAQRESRHV